MMERLEDIAHALIAEGKGILAADESPNTIKKRFNAIRLESTEENRRNYREMLFSTKEAMRKYISGVILHDETIRQKVSDGSMLTDILKAVGSLSGIKVDLGSKLLAAFPGETITEGLDGLRGRLREYYELGARFAKWRAVIAIDRTHLPTRGAIRQNAHALARYAALCQEAGIVPIIEPEVLMDGNPGNHSIDRCYDVTRCVLEQVFAALGEARVKFKGMLLKPNMVIDGENARHASVEEVAEKTLHCLKETVPAAVPGIVFLSGGQSDEEATAHLSAMNSLGPLPWALTFSYGRALQAAAMAAWGGKKENIAVGQHAFSHRARMNYLAALGKWSQQQEKAA
ncbi:MAG: class I [Candidatus Tokpelaia sp. JSC189]|nr:MAG: class I [Candidatus Tokpelaia sp. JSC189]